MLFKVLRRGAGLLAVSRQQRTQVSSALQAKGIAMKDMATGNPLKLPRLPIPALEDTVRRYLKSLEPYAGEHSAELKAARAAAADFLDKDGQELHLMVVEQDRVRTAAGGYPFSYIEKFWDDMYLCGRWALPINSNPFLALAPPPQGSLPLAADPQIAGAARFLSSFLKFCNSIRGGSFQPDSPPGCVAPYPLQLGTGRVARAGRDDLTLHPEARHVVVVCADRFFRLELLDAGGRQLAEDAIVRRLGGIRAAARAAASNENSNSSGNRKPAPFVGSLTSMDRDAWASVRQAMERDSANRRALEAVDSGLIMVALDDEAGDGPTEEAKLFLHGRAGRNRWFDKHQLAVLADGAMAVNFEHSYSDGMAWCRMLGDVWGDMHGAAIAAAGGGATLKFGMPLPVAETCGESALAPPQEITFSLDKALADVAGCARAEFEAACAGCGLSVLDFDAFGKNEVKKWKVSPDAAAQMAFQLAYRSVHGGAVAPTYESCSTRLYHHGRTENIRAATAEGAAFSAAMLDKSASDGARRAALAAAAAAHVALAKDAQKGMGVDRHLAAMRHVAAREAPDLGKAFFADPMVGRSSTWLLSTSNLSYPFLTQFGFGAVTGAGYGVGYMVHGDSIRATVTNFRGGGTDTTDLVEAMEVSLMRMRELHSSSPRQ